MKFFIRLFIIICMVSVILLMAPGAMADDFNRKTKVTFTAPVEVPGVGAQLLPAGTYVFKILDSLSDRHIVQIFNEDETHLYTTILAIPNYRLHSTDKTVMTFRERAQGEPQAVRTWFYPNRQWGEEFVYPKSKALELAKIVNEPVLYTPVEVATIDDLKVAPVEAVKPTGEVVPVAAVIEPAPVQTATMEELPATASYLPLLALVGLLAMGAAGLLTRFKA